MQYTGPNGPTYTARVDSSGQREDQQEDRRDPGEALKKALPFITLAILLWKARK